MESGQPGSHSPIPKSTTDFSNEHENNGPEQRSQGPLRGLVLRQQWRMRGPSGGKSLISLPNGRYRFPTMSRFHLWFQYRISQRVRKSAETTESFFDPVQRKRRYVSFRPTPLRLQSECAKTI